MNSTRNLPKENVDGEVSIKFRSAEKKANIALLSAGMAIQNRPMAMAVIEVIDYMQQKLLCRKNLHHSNQYELDLSPLSKGVYLLKVTDNYGIEHFGEIVAG